MSLVYFYNIFCEKILVERNQITMVDDEMMRDTLIDLHNYSAWH